VSALELDDIRRRVTPLETEMSELRESQWASRRAADLFSIVDRDLADINAKVSGHKRVLQALCDTQLEQGRELAEQRGILTEHTSILTEHSEALTALREGLAGQAGVLAKHGETLDAVMTELRAHGRILARFDPGDLPAGS
jgi:chromosome segregation ATPase